MQFGMKKKDAPETAGGAYLRRFKKGETKVRFMEETDDWNQYREHFTSDRKSFPCTEDETCPGCASDNESVRKASRKYATQVLLVKQNIVLPFAIPVSLADRLAIRAERNGGTLLTRDYVVLRSGDGFDTEYDVDQEDKYPVDLNDLRKKIVVDIQDCHNAAYNEVWGKNTDVAPRTVEETIKEQPEDPPTKPGDDTQELTETQIRAMDLSQLHELCDKAGVPYEGRGIDTKGDLIDLLLKEFAE